LTIDQ